MSACTHTTRETSLGLSSRMVTYIFYCIIIVYILSSLIKKKSKNSIGRVRKEDISESVQKTVLWNANYDSENNDYMNDFSTNFI